MLSRVEAGGKKVREDSTGKLLNEIETISRALYLDKTLSKGSASGPSNRSRSSGKTQFPDPKSKLNYGVEDLSQKDKKSIWNWKPLKALSTARNRKFNCCFSLQVHSIEELPSSFNNASFCVHWKRRDGELLTRPAKVLDGIAEFEEKLTHVCVVYGSRSGPHHSAKYEAKHFLLFASLLGAKELDLGKHRVDLTRLLPLTLEELEDEKSSGKWTTSYKLSGEAKGAVMNVSFGYTVVSGSLLPSGNCQNGDEESNIKQNNLRTVKPDSKSGQIGGKSTIWQAESLPRIFDQNSLAPSRSLEDVKDLHEVLPISRSELVIQVDPQHHLVYEDKSDIPASPKPEPGVYTEHLDPIESHASPLSESHQKTDENECEDGEFSITEQGMELSPCEPETPKVDVAVANVSGVDVQVGFEEVSELQHRDMGNCSVTLHDCDAHKVDICSKESVMKELESALNNVSKLEVEAFDSLDETENQGAIQTNYETTREGMPLCLDDDMESVANNFLDMLGIEHSPMGLSSESEPESPRERLLRQFEEDALAGGFSLFDFDANDVDQGDFGHDGSTMPEWSNLTEDFDLASVIQAVDAEHRMEAQAARSKTRAKTLEDLESEALMREWGLNDNVFQCSPPKGGFGSPIDMSPDEPLELPPLGEGLGPFMQTKNGGFLQSMNPAHFRNANSGGNLIMQVSSPVVVPAEMGSDVMDILQGLASIGIEKLSMQANKLMPLEDITGKTMQQVAWEAGTALEGCESQSFPQHEIEIGQDVSGGPKKVKGRSSVPMSIKFSSASASDQVGSEYVSLEELAPLAMDKIEALSMEGLRIQSGMSGEDAPSNISAKLIGELSALQGNGINIGGSLGMEGTAGLQLTNVKDAGDEVDGLMGLSLTLDEWMRLDSGDIGDEDQISERTSKILAAHHASSLDSIRGGSKGDRRRGKGFGRKCGLLGNNFTVALMVQLRDPLRDYEPVGMPMLALIQVERVFVPPKPKIYCKVSEVRNNNQEDDEPEPKEKEQAKEEMGEEKSLQEEGIPQFRINEVHVAGLTNEPGKNKLWGTTTQQQSGSRWLIANGMGKSNKHPLMKTGSKSASALTTKAQPGDKLWSISSRAYGSGAKRKELAASNPHKRNPNLLVPNRSR